MEQFDCKRGIRLKLVNPVLLATVLGFIFIILGCGNGERRVDSTADPFKASTGSKRVHDPDESKQGGSNQAISEKFAFVSRFALQWGTEGSGNGEFSDPHGIAVGSDGSVYVADTDNNRIQKFTSNGKFVRTWGTRGRGDGEFASPVDVAVAYDGSVYVLDLGNYRIQKFMSDGVFVAKWGTESSGFYMDGSGMTTQGGIYMAQGIAVAPDGSVYITDFCSYPCVQKFTSEGVFIREFGTEGSTTLADGSIQYTVPGRVAAASDGSVYFADSGINQIQKFTPDGVLIDQWGTEGAAPGKFDWPAGVAEASDGGIYVAERGNHRIQKFTPDGLFVDQWGTEGTGNGEFKRPIGIAVGPDSSVYVVDNDNNRIQKFEIAGQ